jgi:ammonium transporter, Amt family
MCISTGAKAGHPKRNALFNLLISSQLIQWMMVSTFLVFIMHLGFATVESGLTRAKNTVNILFKNTLIPAIGLLTYALIGFNLMYPGEGNWLLGGWLGFAGFGVGDGRGRADQRLQRGVHLLDRLPVPGDVRGDGGDDRVGRGGRARQAEQLPAVFGDLCRHRLSDRGLVGGAAAGWPTWASRISPARRWCTRWAAGARWRACSARAAAGQVQVNGGIRPIMGHNMPLVVIGRVPAVAGLVRVQRRLGAVGRSGAVSYVLVTTSLAAAAGIVTSMLTSWSIQKKPDLTMVLNGCLAGLVGITAGADVVSVRRP